MLVQNIAATALFLANKTEENCRKTRDLIIAVAKVAQKNAKLIIDEQSKEYWRWRDSILTYEELMLEMLTFDLMVDNPYQRLFENLRELDLIHNKRLRESAWAFCNDACLTILPLLMDARDVSVSAIFFATCVIGEKIDDVNGEPWWISLRGNEDRMAKAVGIVSEFYKENPLKKQDSRAGSMSPIFRLENTRRRGETINSQTEAGSSRNGTPMSIDRGTQSPMVTSNGRGDKKEDLPEAQKESSGEDAAAELASQASRGDSDAALKAAANDLNIHDGKPNGSDIQSPGGKRKEPDLEDSDTERQQKRARTAELE
jgi:protein BUR2